MATDPLEEGQELMLGGDYSAAQSVFRSMLDNDSEDDSAWFYLGLCHAAAGDHDEAERCFQRCLDCNPGHIEALIELGEVEFARDRPEEAILIFSRATALDPSNARAWVAVARIHELLGMDVEAIANYEKAMMLAEPGEAPGYDLALAYARVGKRLHADIILDGLIRDTLRQVTQNSLADLAPPTRDDILDYIGELKQDRDEIRDAYEAERGYPIDIARALYEFRASVRELDSDRWWEILREVRMLRHLGFDAEGRKAVHRLHSLPGRHSGLELACAGYALCRLLDIEPDWVPAGMPEVWDEVESLF